MLLLLPLLPSASCDGDPLDRMPRTTGAARGSWNGLEAVVVGGLGTTVVIAARSEVKAAWERRARGPPDRPAVLHDGLVTPIEDTLPEPSPEVDADRLADIVDELAVMNSDDWSTFVDGVADLSAVRVEIAFAVPVEDAAQALADDLVAEGYETAAVAPQAEFDEWTVRGTTPTASVTEPGLAEWVRRLAAYGLDHDECVLDGWAAVLD